MENEILWRAATYLTKEDTARPKGLTPSSPGGRRPVRPACSSGDEGVDSV